MLKGNKGEWSELYVLLSLLADGKIYAADDDLHRIEDVYFPILKVFRREFENQSMEYRISSKQQKVELYINGDRIRQFDRDYLKRAAALFYAGILDGGRSSFEIEGADEIADNLNCKKIKAPSSDKTDIKMQIHDSMTGYTSICGYSIKSDLGNPPSLLNASGATNFKYEISGLTSGEAARINAIDTRSKLRDRVTAIRQTGQISFVGAVNEVFAGNLMFIDSMMEDIIGNLLLLYYGEGIIDCASLATRLEEIDPLGYKKPGIYRYKLKKFLCAIALGLMPATPWDGRDEANGGYIIVTESGDVLAYQLYNRDSFENYLLNNTRFETPSSGRHGFGTVYEDAGKMYINLNLQVRFI